MDVCVELTKAPRKVHHGDAACRKTAEVGMPEMMVCSR